ncbi:MAG: XRE family transcriptional regulator [Thermomicrobiales bacterium]|nr:XRE family transcriptional regulator [Thermomicrobiales bacterium]
MADSLALAELRQSQGLTQREVAETLGVSQANISRIEHEEDVYLSTLRSYAEALGGRLEINVVFPEMTYTFVASDEDGEG